MTPVTLQHFCPAVHCWHPPKPEPVPVPFPEPLPAPVPEPLPAPVPEPLPVPVPEPVPDPPLVPPRVTQFASVVQTPSVSFAFSVQQTFVPVHAAVDSARHSARYPVWHDEPATQVPLGNGNMVGTQHREPALQSLGDVHGPPLPLPPVPDPLPVPVPPAVPVPLDSPPSRGGGASTGGVPEASATTGFEIPKIASQAPAATARAIRPPRRKRSASGATTTPRGWRREANQSPEPELGKHVSSGTHAAPPSAVTQHRSVAPHPEPHAFVQCALQSHTFQSWPAPAHFSGPQPTFPQAMLLGPIAAGGLHLPTAPDP